MEGIGFKQVLRAAPRVNWLTSAGYLASGSLWTGNNSFTSFSRVTVDAVLALLALGLAARIVRLRSAHMPERVLFTAVLLFLAGIAYETCAMVASLGGAVAGPHPCYAQVLLAPVCGLACLGFSRLKLYAGLAASLALTLGIAALLVSTRFQPHGQASRGR